MAHISTLLHYMTPTTLVAMYEDLTEGSTPNSQTMALAGEIKSMLIALVGDDDAAEMLGQEE